MKLVLIEGRGWEKLSFGSSRAEARAILGLPERQKLSDPELGLYADFYTSICAIVAFDSDDKLEYIDFSSPASPVLQGTELLNLTFEEANEFLMSLDPRTQIHSTGIDSPTICVSMYFPFGEDDKDAYPESVMVFRRGYLDSVLI